MHWREMYGNIMLYNVELLIFKFLERNILVFHKEKLIRKNDLEA